MDTQTRLEIRSGLMALVLTGILFTLSVALRGPLDRDPAALMRAALSPNFARAVTLGLIGVVVQIYGLFGLYRLLTYQRQSLIALVAFMLVPGIGFLFPLLGFLAVNVPVIAKLYQQGNSAVIAVVEANFAGRGLILLSVSSITGGLDAILFAVAMWQDARLPKWIGVTWALHGLLLALSGPGAFVTEMAGAVLALILACALAWKGWQQTLAKAEPAQTTLRPAQIG